jgi:hypothetical protein
MTTSSVTRTLPTTDWTSGTTSIVHHGHTGLQPGHDVVVLVAAATFGVGAKRERQEEIHLLDAGHRRHDLAVEQEVGVEHADNFELRDRVLRRRKAVEHDRLADDVRICVERDLPEPVAEDDDGCLSRRVLVRQEQSAAGGLRAEHVKQVRRRLEHLNPLRFGKGRLAAAADQRSDASL